MPSARMTIFLAFLGVVVAVTARADLPDTIVRIKPSIVAIGTYNATRRPPQVFVATGFVVADGRHAVTNSHAVPSAAKLERTGALAVYLREGKRVERRKATLLARDDVHDLALLRFEGGAVAPMKLGKSAAIREGELYAFTGFPIGMVLGMRPVTHRGIVSAITPIALPQIRTRELSAKMIKALRHPYNVLQLDATAYPGNSGSPVYHPDNGQVIGVINKVFVKSTKENVLKDPSGITYAIPVNFVRELLLNASLQP